MPVFSADLIVTNAGAPIRNGSVSVADDGTVCEISNNIIPEATHYDGILIPGFINTHCHLELSHMKGLVPEGLGMAGFIDSLLTQRFSINGDVQLEAMHDADEMMLNEGIVAVGDISNSSLSVTAKKNSRIFYHTFVELLGINPDAADKIISEGKSVADIFNENNLSVSLTAHAPYSISQELFSEILKTNVDGYPLSIHLQESIDELEFCSSKSGPLAEVFEKLKINYSTFKTFDDAPLIQMLSFIRNNHPLIAVHNTFTSEDDIEKAFAINNNITWCICPSANKYITQQLPPLGLFNHDNINVAIGTDSLASNHKLSVLHELKAISNAFKEIPFERLISWGTINGAKALQIDNNFGSIQKGKKPGLVLLTNINPDSPVITESTQFKRLI